MNQNRLCSPSGQSIQLKKTIVNGTRNGGLDMQCVNHKFQIYTNINYKVSKGAKITNRYNQVPHLAQDTNGKVTNSQPDTTNESQEVSPFPAGDHKAHINRRAQRHSKHMTEQKHKSCIQNTCESL